MPLSDVGKTDAKRAFGASTESCEFEKALDWVCGTLTITNSGGTGTITVPGTWGGTYGADFVVLLGPESGPTTAVMVYATKAAGLVTLSVVASGGSAVDCSTTNCVVDYAIRRK
jgi:hypothetical protein